MQVYGRTDFHAKNAIALERLEAPGDQITDARGQGQAAGSLASATPQAVLIERAHRLHGDEGIALAHRPDLRFDLHSLRHGL
jgi:hypothetical protein